MTKRARTVDKQITYISISVGLTSISKNMTIDPWKEYPGTFFDLHYDLRARLENAGSVNSEVTWAFAIQRKGTSELELNAPQMTDVTKLLAKGAEVDVLASGVMMTARELLIDEGPLQAFDRATGQVKTERRMKAGDTLVFLVRGNAALGTRLKVMCTYWKRT